MSGEVSIRPEDIEPEVVDHFIKYGAEDDLVNQFIKSNIVPLLKHRRGNRVYLGDHPFTDPIPYLNRLFYLVMKTGSAYHPIPFEAIEGLGIALRRRVYDGLSTKTKERY